DKILSTGQGVVSLILNGLGFVNKRLYLVSHFFKNKPIDKLLDVSYLTPEHLNDDALGRTLDAVYEYGVNKLYALISHFTVQHLSKHYDLDLSIGHLDNSNFHLHCGEKQLYKNSSEGSEGSEDSELVLHITRGHSKDHRPDLVQVGLQLIVNHSSRIPLMLGVLSGNEEEGKSYGKFVETYANELQNDYGLRLFVVDSKLYNQDNLSILSSKDGLKWLTRVPHTLGCVKEAFSSLEECTWHPLKGYEQEYSYQELGNIYGDVSQRWLVLRSKTKYEKDVLKFDKKVAKCRLKEAKLFKKISTQEFENKQSALDAIQQFCKKLQYSSLKNIEITPINHYATRGKPKKGAVPTKTTFKVHADIEPDNTGVEIQKKKEGLGCFILATNELDEQVMPIEKLLETYKKQIAPERAFRFLKDPNIVASSLFVQKPQRIIAILMIMTLCLLVYSALEFKTRTLLKKNNTFFENQLGKPVQNPSMRWVFECFEGIHILYMPDKKTLILNMEEHHRVILDLLGKQYWDFYT
ncbi:MAG: IS1634 family transposase, partial [Chitinophagales bacterium]